jgi:hypothetical protein
MKGIEMEQKTYSSQEMIRRQLHHREKLFSAFEQFGPDLYWHLKQMVAIAEKYESRDVIDDSRALLAKVENSVHAKMDWN